MASFLAGAFCLAAPSLVQAQATASAADVRCLLAMAAASGVEPSREVGTLGTFFYLGRVLAIEPGFDFSTRLKIEASSLGQNDIAQEVQRCGRAIMAASEGMKIAQASLNERAPVP